MAAVGAGICAMVLTWIGSRYACMRVAPLPQPLSLLSFGDCCSPHASDRVVVRTVCPASSCSCPIEKRHAAEALAAPSTRAAQK